MTMGASVVTYTVDSEHAADGLSYVAQAFKAQGKLDEAAETNRRSLAILEKKGAGRESAHEAIKEHAVAAIRDLRSGKIVQNDLLQRLAADQRLGLSEAELQSVLDQGRDNSGDAGAQVDHFARQVEALAHAQPEAASYTPRAIL